MRRIAHISDLHFGRHDPGVIRSLVASLEQDAPALVVVSGDLTQRARSHEFVAARAFLDALPAPSLVVPGNHDVPLWNPWTRFVEPLEKYKRYVTDELEPGFVDDELAVLGVNTARSLTFQEGRISVEQIDRLGARFKATGDGRFRVLVTHHPFLPSPDLKNGAVLGRAARALAALEAAGAELLLTGHLHVGFTGDVTAHYPEIRRSIIVVQAGTAISTRLRGVPNAYNLITVDPPRLRCEARAFDGERFSDVQVTEYRLEGTRWNLVTPDERHRPVS